MLRLHSSRLKLPVLSVFLIFLHISSSTANAKHADSNSWQLLNTPAQPSTSHMAKTSLLSALDTHINNERMSVSQVKYRVKPLIKKASVDQGSDSIFQSLLKVKSFKLQKQAEQKQALIGVFKQYIAIKIANGDLEKMSEAQILAKAEQRYEEYQQKLKLHGAEKKGILNGIKENITNYAQMKAEEKHQQSAHTKSGLLTGNNSLDLVIKLLQRTPEQVEAMQYYQLQRLTVNSIALHSPQQRRLQNIYSIDTKSATQQISIQLPIAVDFGKGSLTLDPSVVMPMLALSDNHKIMPLPTELEKKLFSFNLPQEVLKKVPSDVIYDALIDAMLVAFTEMDSENFTSVNISQDRFSQTVKAKNAVKIHWNSKQVGSFLGKIVKSMSKDITAHIEQNPSRYTNRKAMVTSMKNWKIFESSFQSKDIGRVMQVFNAILPMSFDNTVYYYLDSDNKLVGYQSKFSIDNPLYNTTTDGVIQTRYDSKSVKKSPLYPLWYKNFGTANTQRVDGIAWFKNKKNQKQYYKTAKSIRDSYQSALESVDNDTYSVDEK